MAAVPGLDQTALNLSFDYTLQNTSRGGYYQIQGQNGLYQTAERPVLPLTTVNRDSADKVARGVLMLGGTFNDVSNFDPVVMGLLSDDSGTITDELRHDVPQWLTLMPASINRFWSIAQGVYSQNVVVTPGQFRATSTGTDPRTVGTMRLYSDLDLLVYEAPGEEPDYLAPGIWQVAATPGAGRALTFSALVADSPAADFLPATGVMRVVVLYRHLDDNTWSRADLTYSEASQLAVKTIVLPKSGDYEYFVQAVDNAGNVNPVLDHGNYFQVNVPNVDPEPDGRIVYVSARTGGTVDGITYDTNDILAYVPETDSWSIYFDGNDVGINSNLNAFSLLDDGSILLSPAVRANLAEIGWVEPQDIVRFTPVALGQNTAGSFSFFLDGSDVGLLTSSEAINGISFTPAGRLVITTLGNATIPGPGGQSFTTGGNAMLLFQANTLGTGTSGYWELYLDGNTFGLAGNRISAQWVDPDNGNVYFTPRSTVTIDSQTFQPSDIVRCEPLNGGPITGCTFALYWSAAAHDATLSIESLDLGQGLPFEPPTGSITIVKQVTDGSGSFNFNGDLGSFTLTVTGPNDSANETFSSLQTGSYLVGEDTPTGWQVNSIVCDDPDGGTSVIANNQVRIDLDMDESITCTFTNAPESTPIDDTIYVSPSRKGSVAGIAYDDSDILRYTPAGQWQMYFDGSDVGLGLAGVKAFIMLSDNSILLSPTKALIIGGIGRIGPEDIIRFVPTSTGATTSGSFQMYFDGSDVDLTSRAEAIDAMSIDASGKLIISVRGRATVGVRPSGIIKARKSDLLSFTFDTTGNSTSGTWAFHFDGADAGLNKENIDGLWIDPINNHHYLSVTNSFNLGGGILGGGGTIFVCDPVSLGYSTSCNYSLYWDAAAAGLSPYIDGIHIQR